MPSPPAVAPPPASPGDGKWMLVSLAGELFGLEVRDLREVVPGRPFTRLPGAPPYVRGLVNLRGRVVTVVDLGARLRGESSAGPGHRLVLVAYAGREVGLAVDDVVRIRGGETPADDAADASDAEPFEAVETAALLGPIFG